MRYNYIIPLFFASCFLSGLALKMRREQERREHLREKCERLRQQLAGQVEALVAEVETFLLQDVTPEAVHGFENKVAELTRKAGLETVSFAYNALEPDATAEMPGHLDVEATAYSRINQKTPNRNVATLFGTMTLWRYGYRPTDRDSAEKVVFPLEHRLGLVSGATPGLAEKAAQAAAAAGATQRRVLERLRQDHGVSMGVKRLRQLLEELSARLEEQRQPCQVERLLQLLEQAFGTRGRHLPVLCVGRDGITLRCRPHGYFEVATSATVTIYDRRGRRLGTVYLAYVPESGQGTMSAALTRLLTEVLRQWHARGRQLPRLCYVTDAGDNEEGYFRRSLPKMCHPGRPGQRLEWHWCVDYWHAAERLSVLAKALLGEGGEAAAWVRKMRKLLVKPNGVSRVLNSAAKLRQHRGVRRDQRDNYRKASNYLRRRAAHMQYARYRQLGMPIGSGVTEAACKTIYTQRLKLSGMSWRYHDNTGAQTILNLRVLLLSGVWDQAYRRMLRAQVPETATQRPHKKKTLKNAA